MSEGGGREGEIACKFKMRLRSTKIDDCFILEHNPLWPEHWSSIKECRLFVLTLVSTIIFPSVSDNEHFYS